MATAGLTIGLTVIDAGEVRSLKARYPTHRMQSISSGKFYDRSRIVMKEIKAKNWREFA
jgi:hypothetical protein